jgi:GxxExxY protein
MGHQFVELSSQVLAAAINVHKALGAGFVEPNYQKAMQVALQHRGIAYERQKEVRIFFEEIEIGVPKLHLVVFGQIILELEALKALAKIHFAQLLSYLKATSLYVGFLLNFNSPTLVIKRVVLSFSVLFRVFVLS